MHPRILFSITKNYIHEQKKVSSIVEGLPFTSPMFHLQRLFHA
ncbi:hypothetical protein [Paenibacillus sp. FSL H8-0175]